MPTPYVRNKTVWVVTTPNPNPPGGYTFGLSENGSNPKQQISFENENHPGSVVYFKIRDDANTGLLFQPNPANALWVAGGVPGAPLPPPCPVNPSASEQFVPLSVENGGQKLIVYCRNKDPNVLFRFALRFVAPDGRAINYDPIGDGQNGPRGGF
jgi:hypothetical protein